MAEALYKTKAISKGGRAGGKVALSEGGLWLHMEHSKPLGGSGEGVNPEQLRVLLADVAAGRAAVDAAVERLRAWPFESLGYATVDHHRAVRCGHPEVIFCQGKTVEQVVGIARRMAERGAGVLATRADAGQRAALAD